MEQLQLLSLTLGAAWTAGINLYATVLVLGVLHASGAIVLPAELGVLAHPAVLTIAAFLFVIEFVADKIPGVDSAWDALHTFIRVPAGAVLAAKALGPVEPVWEFGALLVGGSLAATAHSAKAGARLLLNASPEPVTNWSASLSEDLAVIGGLIVALHFPYLFLGLLLALILLSAWILPKGVRALRRMFGHLFGADAAGTAISSDP